MTNVDLGTAATSTWATSAPKPATLTVTLPDTTVQTIDGTPVAAGFQASIPTPQAGRYVLRWTAAGASWADVFDVWPEDPRMLIGVDDARSAVGKLPAARTDDLRLYIAAATPVIEDIVGAILIRTVTQRCDGGKTGVALWERPDTIQSVTANGEELLLDVGYTLDEGAAILYAGAPDSPGRFPRGRQNISVSYTAGMAQVPPNVQLAARELVRHNWQVSMQGSRPAFGDDPAAEDMARTPTGFAVPRRVIQLCAPNPRLPGIA